MKKSLLLLASLAFATASFAQPQVGVSQVPATTHLPTHRVHRMGGPAKTPEQRADHRTTMLTQKLHLTAEQQPRVRQILLAQAQEGQALQAKYPGQDQRQALHQAMKAGHAKYQAQLQSVLSGDQASQLAALKQEHRHGEHGAKTKAKS